MTTRRRRSAERVTLSDVARNAGCSLMSASRALSQPDLVSDALRDRVEQAVKALSKYHSTRVLKLRSAEGVFGGWVSHEGMKDLRPVFEAIVSHSSILGGSWGFKIDPWRVEIRC